MHRSGTSAIAELLQSLGCDLGPAENLIPATSANPRGHFESLPIVETNELLLAKVGAHWLVPPATSDDLRSLASDSTMRSAALDALTEAGYRSDGRPFAIKDPRFCLTLPFWQEVLANEFTVIAMYRKPDEVASSLHTRDGLDPAYSSYLWDCYNEQLLSSLGTTPTLAVSYHDLVSSSTTTAALLQRLLPGLHEPDTEPIDATLHRHKSHHSSDHSDNRLWQQLEALGTSAGGPNDVLAPSPPPPQVSQPTFAYLGREWAELRCALTSVQAELRAVHAEQLNALQQEHESLRDELELVTANAQADIATLQAEKAALVEQFHESQAALHGYEHSRAAGIARLSWQLKDKLRARASGD